METPLNALGKQQKYARFRAQQQKTLAIDQTQTAQAAQQQQWAQTLARDQQQTALRREQAAQANQQQPSSFQAAKSGVDAIKNAAGNITNKKLQDFIRCKFPAPFSIFLIGKEIAKKNPFFFVLFSLIYATCFAMMTMWSKIQKNKIDERLKKAVKEKILKWTPTYTMRDFVEPWEWIAAPVTSIAWLLLILVLFSLTGGGQQ